MATIPEEIAEILDRLPLDKQRRVLDFARAIEQSQLAPRSFLPPGKPIEAFLNFRSTLPPEVVAEMERAIEEDCETIEPDDDKLSF